MQKDDLSLTLSSEATVTLPGSKVHTLQAILVATLADGASELTGIELGLEVGALLNVLQQLGIVIQVDTPSRSCIIAGCKGKLPKTQAMLDCSHLQSSLAFLLLAVASTTGVFYFHRAVTLEKEKLSPALALLNAQGAQFIPDDCTQLPFTLIASSLAGGEIQLDDHAAHDVITALLLLAPFTKTTTQLTLSDLTHEAQLDLTCGLMADFGVLVHRPHASQFNVSSPQFYQARDYRIEPDLIPLFYHLAAAAMTGRALTIAHFNRSRCKQMEIKHVGLFEKMGCVLNDTNEGLHLNGGTQLTGCEFSMRPFGDHFLALVAMAMVADAPSRIAHYGVMHEEEVTLLQALQTVFQALGLTMEKGEHWIRIYPGKLPASITHVPADPRLNQFMALLRFKSISCE